MRATILAMMLLPGVAAAQTTVRQEAAQVFVGGAANGVVLATGVQTVASVNPVNAATAGYAVLYDSATVPADGAVTPSLIRWCMPIAANTGIYTPLTTPPQFYYGVTFFVSSTSCTTKAAVTYGYVGVQVRQ